MPVAHGNEAASVDTHLHQAVFQCARLLVGESPDRGSAPDHRIMMLDFTSPGGRNQLSEGFAADAGEGKVDNIGIAEKVVKKRLNRLQRVRSAKLEENYAHLPC